MMKDLKSSLRLILLVAVMALCLNALTAQSPSPPWFVITPVKDARAVNMHLDLPMKQRTRISLLTTDGTVIWSSSYTDSVLAKSLMLTALPDGDYQVVARNDDRLTRYGFALRGESVSLLPQETVRVTSPNVAIHDRTMIVEISEFESGGPVGVTIFDDHDTQLVQQWIEPTEQRTVRYDLSALRRGNYRLYFKVGEQTFSKHIYLK